MVYNSEITRQMEDPELERNDRKVYVDVYARFTKDGGMEPVGLIWGNGKLFVVDRILDATRAASLKAGGCGIRYTCMIKGKRVQIFYEENYRWFVTANEA